MKSILAVVLAAWAHAAPVVRSQGGSSWAPPYAAVNPNALAGMQQLLQTDAGRSFLEGNRDLGAMLTLEPGSRFDRSAAGALAAALPEGFEAQLYAALRSPQARQAETGALLQAMAAAQAEAAEDVERRVGQRAREVFEQFAEGAMSLKDLEAASKDLSRFRFYGPAVRETAGLVTNLARDARKDKTMAQAQGTARVLLDLVRGIEKLADTPRGEPPDLRAIFAGTSIKVVPGGRFGAIDLRPARLAAGEDGDFPTERPAGYAPPAPLTALKAPETGTPAAIYAALAAVGTGLAGVMGMLISLFAGHPDNAVAAWTVGSIVSFSAAALGFAVGKGPRIYPPLAGASALILAGGAATLALYGAFVLAAGLAIAAAALAAAGVINAGGIRGVLKGLRHAFAEPEPLRAPTAPEKGSGASIVMSSLGMGMAFANAIVAVSYAALGAGALPIIGHAVAAGAILLYSISEFARWRRDQVSSALDEVRHAFADPEPTRDPGPDVSDFPGSRGRWYI